MSDSRKYRILHIFSGYGGGVSSLVLNLLENKTDEFECDILTFSYSNGEAYVNKMESIGVNCFKMPRPRVEGLGRFLAYIDDICRNDKYDAIHCHIDGIRSYFFHRVSKKYGISTFIIHSHQSRYADFIDRTPLMRGLNQWANYRFASAYMTCSDLAAQYIYGKRYLNRRNAVLIPNGINPAPFKDVLSLQERNQYNKEFAIGEDETVFINVGRLTLQKNHRFMFKIARKMLNDNKRFKMIFVGSGELEGVLKNEVNKLGLSQCVIFTGRRNDIAQLMKFSDVFLLPSLWEGLPTVAIECQAAGTPIIISDAVTRQCDMGLGIVEFLPIADENRWIATISRMYGRKLEPTVCLETITDNGFDAHSAGKIYCEEMMKILRNSSSVH